MEDRDAVMWDKVNVKKKKKIPTTKKHFQCDVVSRSLSGAGHAACSRYGSGMLMRDLDVPEIPRRQRRELFL